jgi:hypothetical protein
MNSKERGILVELLTASKLWLLRTQEGSHKHTYEELVAAERRAEEAILQAETLLEGHP